MKKKQLIWLGIFITLVAIVLMFDSQMLSQPTKLKGGFKEIAFFRNQNNTGPVIRIYSVTVSDPENADYENYGNAMPYTLHGNTKVYFFEKEAPETLFFNYPHFDTLRYKALKVYERNGANQISIKNF